MSNVFFYDQQHENKTKRSFMCIKQIKSGFFSDNGNERFYSQHTQNVKTGLYRKLDFQSKFSSSAY